MNIFYKPDIKGNQIILDKQESMHCIKVMRSKVGDQIRIIDGIGGFYLAEICDANYKATKLSLISSEQNYEPLPYELHIALSPTKSIDRFEWFLEKVTEIGVSSITPIIAEHSERKNVRHERMEKVVVAAMKQSLKAYKPIIGEPMLFDQWLSMQSNGFIAHCNEGEKNELWNLPLGDSITIAIGPEGDFSEIEVRKAIDRGLIPVSLGNYRLRTETAGVVAASGVAIKKSTLL